MDIHDGYSAIELGHVEGSLDWNPTNEGFATLEDFEGAIAMSTPCNLCWM